MSEVRPLLEDLIRCPSVTPNDAGCQDLVVERLIAAGFAVEVLEKEGVRNLWATHGSGPPLVCLAGHTDVVPPGPRDAWLSDPFDPTEREGFLFGRGASDMKASDAAMTVALTDVAREGHEGTIALLLTSDEEGPGVYGTRYVLDTLAERGVQIDAAIVGEPTSERIFGDTVKIGRRGSAQGSLRIQGLQGHTAYPHLADNAAHRLAPVLSALLALDWGGGSAAFPPTTFQITHLSAGTGAGNVVPGDAEVRFNIRFGTDWTPEAIQAHIATALSVCGCSSTVKWDFSALPFATEPGPLLSALAAAVQSVTGLVPTPSTGGGTSDARFFAAHGIPVAEFGPLNATIHAANECVEEACLEPLVQVYERILRRLVGGAEESL